MVEQNRIEALGPAERIIQTLTTMTDHMVHNRPGLVTPDANAKGGKLWRPCTWVEEDVNGQKQKVVYLLEKQGNKTNKVRVGILQGDGSVMDGRTNKGEYRNPSDRNKLFPEIAVYLYSQVAEVFKMDEEFAARWASYAFNQENRDLKTILAAFMLVQHRAGQPVMENGEVSFFDDDYREVGEAMFLIRGPKHANLDPKLLLRVGDVLRLEGIAEINRKLGFGKSARTAPMGRYDKAVTRWLRYREDNPKMLEGLVKAGLANTVKALARRVHYKPTTPKFFEILGWSQKQAEDGRRTIAIGEKFTPGISLEGLGEMEICQKIVSEKIGYKRLVGFLPSGQEITPAIMAAVIDSGGLSDRDLIILTPTLEQLGLLTKEPYKSKWEKAVKSAEDQRAANIARNVKSAEAREGLAAAADNATAKALEKATRGLRIYVIVDKSGSMEGAIDKAKEYLAKFLGGFPKDRLHISVFNTVGTEVTLKAQTAAAVEHAFSKHRASGGTLYCQGVKALSHHKPQDDEDALFIFIGDSDGESGPDLAREIQIMGIIPVAFGFLPVAPARMYGGRIGTTVQSAAQVLGIPCFEVDEHMFKADDPYAITRIFRDMIAATPVNKAMVRPGVRRKTLVEEILQTEILRRPTWASV